MTDIHDQKIVGQLHSERAQSLENEQRWLERVLGAIPTPIALVDPRTGLAIYGNPPANAIAELSENELPGKLPADLVMTDANGVRVGIENYPHSRAARGETVEDLELTWTTKNKRSILLFSAVSLPAMHGHPETCVMSFRDITALKAVEKRLKQINHELELFTSIASHDLKEPLRTVSSFLKILKSRYHGKLGTEADEFIDFAVDGATRMNTLIERLLEHGQRGGAAKVHRPTDCNVALRDVLKNLRFAVEEKNARIDVCELPTINGDETQLGQLFQNLFSNALKYNRSESPTIRVECERSENFWKIVVRDNGIGIGESDLAKIFEPFQRLHGRADYSGSGLGLSVCRRIVEMHGGKIWAESGGDSDAGTGTAFVLLLPVFDAKPADGPEMVLALPQPRLLYADK